jgi:hypothetical protein
LLLHKELVGEDITTNLGLAYPSVESVKIASSATYNLAYLPQVFDRHYSISGVSTYVVINKPTRYELHEVNKGHIKTDETIEWQFDFPTMKDRVSKGLITTGAHIPEIVGLEANL